MTLRLINDSIGMLPQPVKGRTLGLVEKPSDGYEAFDNGEK